MLSFASLRPQIMTRTPSSRNRRAVSYPMPLPPPVTMARRFLMPRSMELSFDRVDRLRSSGTVGKSRGRVHVISPGRRLCALYGTSYDDALPVGPGGDVR